jgi:adenosylcobinamide-GDP ribazoletransferase
VRRPLGEPDVAASVAWFPVIGAAVGAASGVVYAGSRALLPSFVAATLAVLAGTAATGALHEDGLADTADAMGAAFAGRDPEPILADPRLGTFGVVALAGTFLLRIGSVASLDPAAGAAALVAAHAVGRAGVAAVLPVLGRRGPAEVPAGAGLGASYARLATAPRAAVAGAIGLVASAALLGPWVAPVAATTAVGAVAIAVGARRRLGRAGGDVLGAIEQVGEIATLLTAAAVPANGWGPLPWWR